jgi:hypothetical protein
LDGWQQTPLRGGDAAITRFALGYNKKDMKKVSNKNGLSAVVSLVPWIFILFFILLAGIFVWSDRQVPKDVFFSLNDNEAHYTILCREIYYLSYEKNGEMSAIAIGKSNQDLEVFCDKPVRVLNGKPNYFYSHPLCRTQEKLCETAKAATFELENISLE